MVHFFFEVELRNVEILPVTSQHYALQSKSFQSVRNLFQLNDDSKGKEPVVFSTRYISASEKLFIKFDFDGYKQMYTETIEFPWRWNGVIHKHLYTTQWGDQLHDKSLNVYCFKKSFAGLSENLVGYGKIDLQTIATGSSKIELALLDPSHTYIVCVLKFELIMNQICKDMTIKIKNINLSSLLNVQQKTTLNPFHDINLSLQYIDPVTMEWDLHHISFIDTQNQHTHLKLKLSNAISAQNFLSSCIQLVFWKYSKAHKSGSVDVARVVVPLLGNYDANNPYNTLDIHDHFFWKNNVENLYNISFTMTIENGPKYCQFESGATKLNSIQGKAWLGFPTPANLKSGTESSIEYADISQHIKDHALHVEQLKLRGYAYENLPDKFWNREPNLQLVKMYNYYGPEDAASTLPTSTRNDAKLLQSRLEYITNKINTEIQNYHAQSKRGVDYSDQFTKNTQALKLELAFLTQLLKTQNL